MEQKIIAIGVIIIALLLLIRSMKSSSKVEKKEVDVIVHEAPNSYYIRPRARVRAHEYSRWY